MSPCQRKPYFFRVDYVALLRVVYELPSFLWRDDGRSLPPEDAVQVRMIPPDSGRPLLIRHICLPFIFAETPEGTFETLDLRSCEITRLDPTFGSVVTADLKSAAKERRSSLLRDLRKSRKKKKRKRRK